MAAQGMTERLFIINRYLARTPFVVRLEAW
jgi:hypothetical protein